MSAPDAGYFLDHYGRCRLDKCECLDPDRPRFGGKWLGRACPDWVPTGATSWVELMDQLRKHGSET